jgi:hypothetical protein
MIFKLVLGGVDIRFLFDFSTFSPRFYNLENSIDLKLCEVIWTRVQFLKINLGVGGHIIRVPIRTL